MKIIKKKAEEGRVAIRNIRRETNDKLKAQQKEGKISEDDLKRKQEDVQKMTDRMIKDIDTLFGQQGTGDNAGIDGQDTGHYRL